jgi:hypothetical protein
MPLRGEGETGPLDADMALPAGDLRALEAPWAGWFDRKRARGNWLGFCQALAFFGLLRGLDVHYRVSEDNHACFGVSEMNTICWFGVHEWQVNSDAARDLGWLLWRAFLDCGGPWPIEFRLKASCRQALPTGPREGYLRHGPKCRQLWELTENRDRQGWI